jgi:ribose 5-phosphate isomerase B
MNIAIGCDHRGFAAKQRIKALLGELTHQVQDFGAFDDKASDYPDAGYAVAKAVRDGAAERGILFCGSGIGMSITANKLAGIRAALVHDEMTAELARRHNDSNVLCLPADLVGYALMRRIIEVWLSTPFDAGRHARRVGKITEIEQAERGCGKPKT